MNEPESETKMAAPIAAKGSASILRVLELYSGIGGMHYALEECGINHAVIGAADINNVANDIYRHNFPSVNIIRRGIEALSAEDWTRLSPDLVTMSPPCQPFTRLGLKKDTKDKRCKSFLNVLEVLPRLRTPPRYIFLENVKGFEDSDTHEKLIQMLKQCQYKYQEFLLSPLQLGIPNQRLRYFLLASLDEEAFNFRTKNEVWIDLPVEASPLLVHQRSCLSPVCSICLDSNFQNRESPVSNSASSSLDSDTVLDGEERESRSETPAHALIQRTLQKYITHCRPISDFLVADRLASECFATATEKTDAETPLLLNDEQLSRFLVLDIVRTESKKSICFTKSYGRLLEGCGSVLQEELASVGDIFADGRKYLDTTSEEMTRVRQLRLRFFTPREVANLMCFPDRFRFPAACTRSQRFRTLGNSLNVHVAAVLLRLLVSDDYTGVTS